MAKKKTTTKKRTSGQLGVVERKLKAVNDKIAAEKRKKVVKQRLEQKIRALKSATAALAGLKRRKPKAKAKKRK